MKIITIITLLLLVALTSCTTQEQVTIPEEKQVRLDINLGFTPNINPEFNASMTTPSPSLYAYKENETENIIAHDTRLYKFSHYKIEPENEEKYEVTKNNYTLNLTQNYTVTAFFGCQITQACNKVSICENNKCKSIIEQEPQPKATITKPNSTIRIDETLATRIDNILKQLKFENIEHQTFEEMTINQTHNQTTIAIFEQEIAIIRGKDTDLAQGVFERLIKDTLIGQGIDEAQIKNIRSNQLRRDLYEIFI